MKPTKFEIVFVNGDIETVYAFDIDEAKILGKANQIRKGYSYDVNYAVMYMDGGIERIIR